MDTSIPQYTSWAFNGNGSPGTMTVLSVDLQGNVEVTVTFDGLNRQDRFIGVWNESAKELTLTRYMPNNVTQTYTGYLGDNDPDALIFGGSFTESDIASTAARTMFGWYAKYSNPVIT